MISIPDKYGLSAYIAQPAGSVKGTVLVIHEVWGLTEHIISVADRLASEGYLALAPDLLGETFKTEGVDTSLLPEMQQALFDPERRNQIQPQLRQLMAPLHSPSFAAKTVNRLKSCFDYLYALPESKQGVAVIGFCFGGTYAYSLAVAEPRLKAALPFYGHADLAVEDLAKINCPVTAFYGEQDEQLMAALPGLREKMAAAHVTFTVKTYPSCGHAFFNDTNRFAYNSDAARDAWQLVLSALGAAFGS